MQINKGPFDLLLGSDLVYNKVCVELLPKLAEHFLLYTIPPVPTGPALDPFHPIPCSCTSSGSSTDLQGGSFPLKVPSTNKLI